MIILKDSNSSLELISTGGANGLQYSVDWVDITTTTFAPSSTEGNITTATTTPIVSAPAASTQRQIKRISVVNVHASTTQTIQIQKDISGTNYPLTPVYSLAPGASVNYEDGLGWSEATIPVGSVLLNPRFSGYTDYDAIANPSTPAADILRIYARKVSGRTVPKWTPPSGLDTPFQAALYGNNVVLWQPGATSGALTGSVGTAIAAGVATLPTTTNNYTKLRRSVFTVATGVNLQNSYRTENMFFRGGGATQGGFFFFARFGFTTWNSGNRLFVGLCVDTTALLTADPSAKFNTLGFGVDAADSAISFIHNDGSGTAPKEPIAGQPALASNNVYDVYIFCKPNDTTVYFRLDDINAQSTIIDSFVTSELPVNTTMLCAQCAIGSGSNAGAAVAAIGLNRLYIESDY